LRLSEIVARIFFAKQVYQQDAFLIAKRFDPIIISQKIMLEDNLEISIKIHGWLG